MDAITGISGWGIFSWEKWYQDQQIWFSTLFSMAHLCETMLRPTNTQLLHPAIMGSMPVFIGPPCIEALYTETTMVYPSFRTRVTSYKILFSPMWMSTRYDVCISGPGLKQNAWRLPVTHADHMNKVHNVQF